MSDPSRLSHSAAVRSAIEPVISALGLDLEDVDVHASGKRLPSPSQALRQKASQRLDPQYKQ